MKFATLKILDAICKITEDIFDVYGDLTDLENNNKKNTSEFKDTLEKLCLLRDRELELYKYFMRDLKEACKAVEYLTRRSDKSLEAATSVTIDADEKEIKQYRIISKLHLIALMDDNYFLNDVDEDLLSLADGKNNMDFLHDAWVMDAQEINYRTVSFLDQFKDDDPIEYTSARNIMSFVTPLVETEFCNNGFRRIKRDFDKKIIKTYPGVSDDFISYVHSIRGLDNACMVAGVLLDYSDADLDDPDELINFNILLAEFKASLLLLDESDLEGLRDEVNDIAANFRHSDEYEEYERSKEIVDDTIADISNDKKFANEDIDFGYEKK